MSESSQMETKATRLPGYVARVIEELADQKESSESEVIRSLVEDQLREQSYMTDLDEQVKESINGGGE